MKSIKGTVKNGRISLLETITWAEGTEVIVTPTLYADPEDRDSIPDLKSDNDTDDVVEKAESIARWIAEFDKIPPLHFTPDEEAQWRAARMAQRELDKASFDERAKQLGRIITQ